MTEKLGKKQRGTIVTDAELRVLGLVVRALEGLDPAAQARTMTYLRDRYGQLDLLPGVTRGGG